MERLIVGSQEVEPLAVRTLSEEEWERGLGWEGVWDPCVEDLLYFRLDGVVHVASFEMKTKLTDVVRQAFERGDMTIEYRGRRGPFLRSEDVENFSGRNART